MMGVHPIAYPPHGCPADSGGVGGCDGYWPGRHFPVGGAQRCAALDLTAVRRGDPVYCESDQAPEGAIRSISVTESTA